MAFAHIRVQRRPQQYPSHINRWSVVLDGETASYVSRGESIKLIADPGEHELHLTEAWTRSPSVKLDLVEGQTAVIECWPTPGALGGLLFPYWMTFGAKRYISIERLPDETA